MPVRRRKLFRQSPGSPLPLSFAEWIERAAEELRQRYNVSSTAMPNREWTRLFIKGVAPEQAAERASVFAYNTRSPAIRLRRGQR